MSRVTSKGTTRRSIRVDDEDWDPFMAQAEAEGTDASAKIRAFIRSENAKARDSHSRSE
ncbi:hypothetical protein [Aeromicrobium sp. 9AM]|uniref:hypothetical protein n=1 Tax=Aeromicrobium sp. 9AM TaxID=2653126 RepID=UPI0012F16C72|nr:hypothetical protein [Aeromicrobium sp. 9AM]VXC09130.1 hypothetical protein AERO9AM_50022 [Aeromicrobium sp. 9AM]